MKNTKKLKQILVTSTLLLGMLTVGRTSSQAALQANQTTHNATTPKQIIGARWIEQIRQMETTGQTMGLNETLNADLTPSSTSNNIDVHMMRTTEYGAMAILSASGFGNPKKLLEVSVKTTTGNATGVYIAGDRWEWTAGVCNASTVGKAPRYYDLYTTNQTSVKVGDALGLDTYTNNPGCSSWHGASSTGWLDNADRGFMRGYGGMFSFSGNNGSNYYGGTVWASNIGCGRGVAVVGQGL